LLSLGIIGKYIAKIFLETKKRPVYIVKEKG
ncbi:glycosyltransferase, partial [Streptococcus mutans]|nr:glycosyltransferase [Streptococcus mutans]